MGGVEGEDMKYETLANEIYWAMEHGELNKIDQLLDDFANKKLAELIRLGNRTGKTTPTTFDASSELPMGGKKFDDWEGHRS